MKRFLVFLLSCQILAALNMQEAIHLALLKSDSLKEKSALRNRSNSLYKTSFSPFIPSINSGYVFSFNTPSSLRNAYVLNSLSLSFNYNIFNGFKDFYSIKNQRENLKRNDYVLLGEKAQIAFQTKTVYIAILQSRDLIEILQERKKNIESQKNRAIQFVQQGIRAKNESLSMDITLSNTLLSLKSAQLNLEYQLHLLEQLLQQSIANSDLEDIEVDDEARLNVEDIFENMLLNNTTYLSLMSELRSALYDKKSSKGNFLPSLNLTGIKFWYIDGAGFANTNYGLQSQIRLNVTWNIFNGFFDKYNLEAIKYYEMSLQSKIYALKREMKGQIQDIVKRYNLAREQYHLNTDTLNKAKENYEITNNRYIQGISTYTELIDAELLLNSTRINISQAKYNMASALAEIDLLINQW